MKSGRFANRWHRQSDAHKTTFPPPLNIGTVKDLLLEYHQKYDDIDVAAVFDSTQKFVEQAKCNPREAARACARS